MVVWPPTVVLTWTENGTPNDTACPDDQAETGVSDVTGTVTDAVTGEETLAICPLGNAIFIPAGIVTAEPSVSDVTGITAEFHPGTGGVAAVVLVGARVLLVNLEGRHRVRAAVALPDRALIPRAFRVGIKKPVIGSAHQDAAPRGAVRGAGLGGVPEHDPGESPGAVRRIRDRAHEPQGLEQAAEIRGRSHLPAVKPRAA